MTTMINCWNEWDPLKRVILGRPDGTNMTAPEPGFMWEDIDGGGRRVIDARPIPQERVDAANKQMDAFQALLEKRGIVVDRAVIHPAILDRRPTSTPDWSVPLQYGANNPRDTHLCIGNQIIEVPMAKRCRYYEYLSLRPLLERYFNDDPDFLWTAAPKPRLSDDRFELDYTYKLEHIWTPEEKRRKVHDRDYGIADVEPLFDAADLIRCGKDIFWLASYTTNPAGREWLKRHLSALGLHFHIVECDHWSRPYHLDAILSVPRPGLMLYNQDWPPITEEFFALLKANEWELRPAGELTQRHLEQVETEWDDEDSPGWLTVNGLSLDPKTICIEEKNTEQIKRLTKLGLDVIPVPYEQVTIFGGSLHCSTLDVYREGKCEDYFPNQIDDY
ncbi:MAG: serine/threonine protein kinase [Deltaproteobacteria bacterium]|nr:serine/threonine protein kinase [Deltaproteobacteria bacterium]